MRIPCLAAVLAMFLVSLVSCKREAPASVAAEVNGRPITYEELEKYYQTQFSIEGAASKTTDEQSLIQKLEVLRSLIDSEIMLQRAEKQGLMAIDADVVARFNELKAPYTQEEFVERLKLRNMTQDDLRAQVRRDLSIQKLFNKEITSHINITDKEVADFYEANKASFNLPEPRIHLAQIVVTPNPDPNVRNLKNDKATNEEQARRKIQTIEARLRQGEDFAMLAQNFSEDANTNQNGGDLGFIPESALAQVSPELRKMIVGMQPGQVSPVIRGQQGYQILKVIGKEPAGQRDINDPRVRQSIRETLLNRKDQLLRAAYYEVARNEAEVRNHLARRISDAKGLVELK